MRSTFDLDWSIMSHFVPVMNVIAHVIVVSFVPSPLVFHGSRIREHTESGLAKLTATLSLSVFFIFSFLAAT